MGVDSKMNDTGLISESNIKVKEPLELMQVRPSVNDRTTTIGSALESLVNGLPRFSFTSPSVKEDALGTVTGLSPP